jgi:hypothetical protein
MPAALINSNLSRKRLKWEYKSDRRTMMREPMKAWDGLARLKCPALFLKAETSVLKPGRFRIPPPTNLTARR